MHFECMCHTHVHFICGSDTTLIYKMNEVDIFFIIGFIRVVLDHIM